MYATLPTTEELVAMCDRVREAPSTYPKLSQDRARLVSIVLAEQILLKKRFGEDLETLLSGIDKVTRQLCRDAQDMRMLNQIVEYRTLRRK